jgi:hypothetical protein
MDYLDSQRVETGLPEMAERGGGSAARPVAKRRAEPVAPLVRRPGF